MISEPSITPFHVFVEKAVRKTGIYKKAEIARRLNASQQLTGRWLKAKDVKLSTAQRIAAAYGMTLQEFLEG